MWSCFSCVVAKHFPHKPIWFTGFNIPLQTLSCERLHSTDFESLEDLWDKIPSSGLFGRSSAGKFRKAVVLSLLEKKDLLELRKVSSQSFNSVWKADDLFPWDPKSFSLVSPRFSYFLFFAGCLPAKTLAKASPLLEAKGRICQLTSFRAAEKTQTQIWSKLLRPIPGPI